MKKLIAVCLILFVATIASSHKADAKSELISMTLPGHPCWSATTLPGHPCWSAMTLPGHPCWSESSPDPVPDPSPRSIPSPRSMQTDPEIQDQSYSQTQTQNDQTHSLLEDPKKCLYMQMDQYKTQARLQPLD